MMIEIDPKAPLVVKYTNHAGTTRTRTIIPLKVWYGTTQWHGDPQWFLRCEDLESGRVKDFALDGFDFKE